MVVLPPDVLWVPDMAAAVMQDMMSQPDVASDPDKFQRLAKEASSIQTQVDKFKVYQEKEESLVDTRALLRDSEGDAEMTELAQEEITELEADLEARFHRSIVTSVVSSCVDTMARVMSARHRCKLVQQHSNMHAIPNPGHTGMITRAPWEGSMLLGSRRHACKLSRGVGRHRSRSRTGHLGASRIRPWAGGAARLAQRHRRRAG